MKERAAAIIIKDGKVLFFHRVKSGREYFCFPGGGIDSGETTQQAAIRELKEELNLDIQLDRLFMKLENEGRCEYYFLVKNFSGTPVLSGPEKERMNENNQYYPVWKDAKEMEELSTNIHPIAVTREVIRYLKGVEMISYEEFKKVELRVAKILQAEKVEGSDKLVKLQVDLGEEKRQIVAGIGKAYAPEDLVGKEIIIVANLEPRTLFGMESQGMLLAASNTNGPVLIVPDKEVVPGSEIG